jgi:hypothetical protein
MYELILRRRVHGNRKIEMGGILTRKVDKGFEVPKMLRNTGENMHTWIIEYFYTIYTAVLFSNVIPCLPFHNTKCMLAAAGKMKGRELCKMSEISRFDCLLECCAV